MKYLTNIAKDARIRINNEKNRINKLYKVIDGYEIAIELLSQTEKRNTIQQYKQRIERCEKKIKESFKIINYNKETLTALKNIDKIIRRGEKCA